jgi:hypothetical protein
MPQLDVQLGQLENGQSVSFGWKQGAGPVVLTGSGCQGIRHCAIPRVRPRARQMGQVQLGNAYHARSAHWTESARRGNSVMAADSVKVSQVEQRLRRTM